jgi:hypothetical protein
MTSLFLIENFLVFFYWLHELTPCTLNDQKNQNMTTSNSMTGFCRITRLVMSFWTNTFYNLKIMGNDMNSEFLKFNTCKKTEGKKDQIDYSWSFGSTCLVVMNAECGLVLWTWNKEKYRPIQHSNKLLNSDFSILEASELTSWHLSIVLF